MGRSGQLAALASAFTLATVVWTWPLAAHLGGGFLETTATPSDLAVADLYLTSWMLAWDTHQLLRAPWRLFEANFFYPLPKTLALSEHLLAGALLVAPAQWLSGNAVLSQNLLVLASFALGATGTGLLVRDLGGSLTASLVAGGLFAFGPLRFAQIGHVHALSTHWLPFAFLFLQRLLRSGQRREAVAFVLTLVLTVLSSVYYFYYAGLGVVAWMGLHALSRCPAAPGARRRAVVAGAVALALVLPVLLPYAEARAVYALAHDPVQAVRFSALGEQYLGAVLDPRRIFERTAVDGRLASPLLGPGFLLLAGLGLVAGRGRPRIAYGLLALLFTLVSLGPRMRFSASPASDLPGPHWLLATVVPGMDALRVPQRAACVALLAAAVLAGLGAGRLLGGGGPRRRFLGSLVLCLLVASECWRPALHLWPEESGRQPPAAYAWLATQPVGPVVELPMTSNAREARYMLLSTHHWRPLVNGYTGTFPARNYLQLALGRFPEPWTIELLARLRVRWIVLHLGDVASHQRALCTAEAPAVPHLARRYADAETCILEVVGAPAPRTRPPERRIDLAQARLTTSAGSDPRPAIDGVLRTHWTDLVRPQEEAWLQVDLGSPRRLARVVVRLGSHFGEHLRTYRVELSNNGVDWIPAADAAVAEPPLEDLVDRPHDLAQAVPLHGGAFRYLRLVRPVARVHGLDLDWGWWGVHELELYEAQPAPAG